MKQSSSVTANQTIYHLNSLASMQSLHRQNSYLQSKVQQLQIQLQHKVESQEQLKNEYENHIKIHNKSLQEILLYRKKMQQTLKGFESHVNTQQMIIKQYQHNQKQMINRLSQYESMMQQINNKNVSLMAQITRKNIFISQHLKINQQADSFYANQPKQDKIKQSNKEKQIRLSPQQINQYSQ